MPAYGRRGGEVVVNKQLVGSQITPSISGFASGGFIVVWCTTDTTQDGAGRAIKAQRYDVLGNPVGPELLINSSAAGDQRAPSVTTLTSGGYVVTWETTDTTQDGSGLAIKGQVFDAFGTALGGEFRVNSQVAADQIRSSVTALSDGRFVVTWQSADPAQDGHTSAIKGQIFSAAGAALGGEFLVNSGAVGGESSPNVTGLAGGGFVATWTLGSGTSADIYAQVFGANGAKVGGQFLVNSTTAFNQDFATVSQLADGRFVVTWQSSASTATGDVEIRARLFSSSGTALGGDFLVNTTRVDSGTGIMVASSRPSVEDLPDGGFVITWTHSAGNYVLSSIRGQFFDSTGARVGGEVIVSTVTNRLEGNADVAVDGNGMLFTVWSSANQSAQDDDIRGQLFTANGAPEITSNGGGSSANLTVAENQTAVTTILAGDPDGNALTYAIVGGVDAARFTINASTGVLTFVQAPNFESRQDFGGDNVYDVVVSVSDGALTDTQALAVTVANVNEGVTIGGSETSFLHIENGTAVATFSAADADGDALTWSIAGGADAARFTIDAATGALRFVAAPNYEAPADAGGNNVYDVIIAASDGSLSASRALTIEVLNWNEGPVITSGGGGDSHALTVGEGASFLTTIVAADPDASPSPFLYSIVGGADAGRFYMHAQTGQLFFASNPDFETPGDADGDNVYDVIVAAGDGWEPADTQRLAVTVADVNERPVFGTGGTSVSLGIDEGQTAVGTFAASDPDGAGLTYAIGGGADAHLFAIDSATGALTLIQAPDYEAPADQSEDNFLNVMVTASDGTLSSFLSVQLLVRNVNEGLSITSGQSFSIAENGTAVTSVSAVDVDGDALSYAIAGGADAALFAIDSATGALSFRAAPNFEAPADSGADNVYDVIVSASDGSFTDTRALSVAVTNANDVAPVISFYPDSVTWNIPENLTYLLDIRAADAEADAVSYSLTGPDAALFSIDAVTGALSWVSPKSFETWVDGGFQPYHVTVVASDGQLSDTLAITINLVNVNEGVSITSNGGGSSASVTIGENDVAVTTVTAVDDDRTAPTFSIVGGADAALFAIDAATGALRFIAAPNFEAPGDAGGDNVYDVLVRASDGSLDDTQAIAVTVANRNEGPSIGTSSLVANENGLSAGSVAASDPDGDALSYSIVGGADAALFTIDAATGALSFRAAPNYEAPGDSNGDNVYQLLVSASDGSIADTRSLTVTVANVNEGLAVTSYGGAGTVLLDANENGTAAATVKAVDLDGNPVAYSISGGADSALFEIDAATGVLRFRSAPNYEAPADADGDNSYKVVVSASDGSFSANQSFSIAVRNVNEGVTITSSGGASAASLEVAENGMAVTTVVAADADGGAVTYAIAGGADAARFTINAATGALRFVSAPNHEAPTDSGGNNVYDVVVSASDGSFTDTQALAVTVTNVREGNVIMGTSANNTISTSSTVSGQPKATELEDTIYGMGGADTITAGGGADIIDGGSGNDTITGGLGADVLTGGLGADRFTYTSTAESTAASRDEILDFSRAEGDKISLSAIDANPNAGGNQNFSFIGAAAFSGAAGQLRYEYVDGNTIVSADVNGDRVADFQIELSGQVPLIASDFIL